MKKLALFRHAKSDWADGTTRDFDRPLNARGRDAAVAMGQYALKNGMACDHIIASPAIRVSETLEIAQQAYSKPWEIHWDRKIYLASSATLLDLVHQQDDQHQSLLMAGHNPGLEDLILETVPLGSNAHRDRVEEKFPSGALAILHFDCDKWSDIARGQGALHNLIFPRELPAL